MSNAHGGGMPRPEYVSESLIADTTRCLPNRAPRSRRLGRSALSCRRIPAAARTLRLCVAAFLFCGNAACARSTLQSPPASGRVTVGVTSRGPGVEAMTFTVAIEPAGVEGTVKGDVGVFTADHT